MTALPSPLAHKWGAPAVLFAFTIIGLILALIGDGWWDVASTVALVIPCTVSVWIVAKTTVRTDNGRFL